MPRESVAAANRTPEPRLLHRDGHSERGHVDALYRRAARVYGVLNAEKCLEEMVQELDRERQLTLERRISTRVSK